MLQARVLYRGGVDSYLTTVVSILIWQQRCRFLFSNNSVDSYLATVVSILIWQQCRRFLFGNSEGVSILIWQQWCPFIFWHVCLMHQDKSNAKLFYISLQSWGIHHNIY